MPSLQPVIEILNDRSELPLQSATDYRQYRVRATRKLARTRKSLGLQKKPPKKNQSAEPRHRLPFEAPSIDQLEKDKSVISVLVCLAERSWAHAMETSAVLDTNFSTNKKSHVRSKLFKACKYIDTATKLVEESPKLFDENEIFQLETYSLLLHGNLSFQTKRYERCINQYSIVRVALDTISSLPDTDASTRSSIQELILTVIDPSIVYSYYRINEVRPLSASSLAIKTASQSDSKVSNIVKKINPAAIKPSEESDSSILDKIQWRSYTADVEDKELGLLLSKTITADKEIDSTKISLQSAKIESSLSIFDDVLQSWQDSRDLVKNNIERLESSSSASQTIQTQYIISTFIEYNMLLRRIQRDVLLLKNVESRFNKLTNNTKTKVNNTKLFEKMQEVVRLYDTIIQSTSELLDLPGIHTDSELQSALQTLDSYYKSERLNALANAYKIASKLPESLALYASSLQTLQTSPMSVSIEFPPNVLDKSKFENAVISTKISVLQLRSVLTIRDNGEKHGNLSDRMDVDGVEPINVGSKAVVDNLSKYSLNALGSANEVAENLISINTEILPVIAKPVFFDIAYNFIGKNTDNASVSSTSATTSSESSNNSNNKKKSGGFLSGLWGSK